MRKGNDNGKKGKQIMKDSERFSGYKITFENL